jgi:hypothetical protein
MAKRRAVFVQCKMSMMAHRVVSLDAMIHPLSGAERTLAKQCAWRIYEFTELMRLNAASGVTDLDQSMLRRLF